MNKSTLMIAASLLVSGVCFADETGTTASVVPANGLRANVTLGGAEALSSSHLGFGSSESLFFGYGSMHGRVGVDVGLELENQTYGSGWLMIGSNRVDTYSGRPTARVGYYGDQWLPYASLGAGYTYVTGTGTIDGMSASGSDNMLAIAASAGIDYRITNRVALGAYVRYEPAFEPALNQFVDFGVALASH